MERSLSSSSSPSSSLVPSSSSLDLSSEQHRNPHDSLHSLNTRPSSSPPSSSSSSHSCIISSTSSSPFAPAPTSSSSSSLLPQQNDMEKSVEEKRQPDDYVISSSDAQPTTSSVSESLASHDVSSASSSSSSSSSPHDSSLEKTFTGRRRSLEKSRHPGATKEDEKNETDEDEEEEDRDTNEGHNTFPLSSRSCPPPAAPSSSLSPPAPPTRSVTSSSPSTSLVQKGERPSSSSPPSHHPRWFLSTPSPHLLALLQREAARCCNTPLGEERSPICDLSAGVHTPGFVGNAGGGGGSCRSHLFSHPLAGHRFSSPPDEFPRTLLAHKSPQHEEEEHDLPFPSGISSSSSSCMSKEKGRNGRSFGIRGEGGVHRGVDLSQRNMLGALSFVSTPSSCKLTMNTRVLGPRRAAGLREQQLKEEEEEEEEEENNPSSSSSVHAESCLSLHVGKQEEGGRQDDRRREKKREGGEKGARSSLLGMLGEGGEVRKERTEAGEEEERRREDMEDGNEQAEERKKGEEGQEDKMEMSVAGREVSRGHPGGERSLLGISSFPAKENKAPERKKVAVERGREGKGMSLSSKTATAIWCAASTDLEGYQGHYRGRFSDVEEEEEEDRSESPSSSHHLHKEEEEKKLASVSYRTQDEDRCTNLGVSPSSPSSSASGLNSSSFFSPRGGSVLLQQTHAGVEQADENFPNASLPLPGEGGGREEGRREEEDQHDEGFLLPLSLPPPLPAGQDLSLAEIAKPLPPALPPEEDSSWAVLLLPAAKDLAEEERSGRLSLFKESGREKRGKEEEKDEQGDVPEKSKKGGRHLSVGEEDKNYGSLFCRQDNEREEEEEKRGKKNDHHAIQKKERAEDEEEVDVHNLFRKAVCHPDENHPVKALAVTAVAAHVAAASGPGELLSARGEERRISEEGGEEEKTTMKRPVSPEQEGAGGDDVFEGQHPRRKEEKEDIQMTGRSSCFSSSAVASSSASYLPLPCPPPPPSTSSLHRKGQRRHSTAAHAEIDVASGSSGEEKKEERKISPLRHLPGSSSSGHLSSLSIPSSVVNSQGRESIHATVPSEEGRKRRDEREEGDTGGGACSCPGQGEPLGGVDRSEQSSSSRKKGSEKTVKKGLHAGKNDDEAFYAAAVAEEKAGKAREGDREDEGGDEEDEESISSGQPSREEEEADKEEGNEEEGQEDLHEKCRKREDVGRGNGRFEEDRSDEDGEEDQIEEGRRLSNRDTTPLHPVSSSSSSIHVVLDVSSSSLNETQGDNMAERSTYSPMVKKKLSRSRRRTRKCREEEEEEKASAANDDGASSCLPSIDVSPMGLKELSRQSEALGGKSTCCKCGGEIGRKKDLRAGREEEDERGGEGREEEKEAVEEHEQIEGRNDQNTGDRTSSSSFSSSLCKASFIARESCYTLHANTQPWPGPSDRMYASASQERRGSDREHERDAGFLVNPSSSSSPASGSTTAYTASPILVAGEIEVGGGEEGGEGELASRSSRQRDRSASSRNSSSDDNEGRDGDHRLISTPSQQRDETRVCTRHLHVEVKGGEGERSRDSRSSRIRKEGQDEEGGNMRKSENEEGEENRKEEKSSRASGHMKEDTQHRHVREARMAVASDRHASESLQDKEEKKQHREEEEQEKEEKTDRRDKETFFRFSSFKSQSRSPGESPQGAREAYTKSRSLPSSASIVSIGGFILPPPPPTCLPPSRAKAVFSETRRHRHPHPHKNKETESSSSSSFSSSFPEGSLALSERKTGGTEGMKSREREEEEERDRSSMKPSDDKGKDPSTKTQALHDEESKGAPSHEGCTSQVTAGQGQGGGGVKLSFSSFSSSSSSSSHHGGHSGSASSGSHSSSPNTLGFSEGRVPFERRSYLLIKKLNFILRHGAPLFKLPMREDGYVRIRQLLELDCMRGVTWEEIYLVVASNYKRRYEICYDPSEPDCIGENFQVTVLDHNQKIPPFSPSSSSSSSSSSSQSTEKEDGGSVRSSERGRVDPDMNESSACKPESNTPQGKERDHDQQHLVKEFPISEKNQENRKGDNSFLSKTSEVASRRVDRKDSCDAEDRLSGSLRSEGEKKEKHSSSSFSPAEGVQDVTKTAKVFPVLDPTHAHQQILGTPGIHRGDEKKDYRDEEGARRSPSSSSSSLLFSSPAGDVSSSSTAWCPKKYIEDITSFLADTPPFPSSTTPDLVSDRWLIRATQGHTIRHVCSELLLRRIHDPSELPKCVHGTYLKNWLAIRTLGLSRMHRNHIHFAPGLPSECGVVSGMRRTSEVAIYINVELAMKDGVRFFLSNNNVILTEGIRGKLMPKYFKLAKHLKWDAILFEDGKDYTPLYYDRVSNELLEMRSDSIYEKQLLHDRRIVEASPYTARTTKALLLQGNHHTRDKDHHEEGGENKKEEEGEAGETKDERGENKKEEEGEAGGNKRVKEEKQEDKEKMMSMRNKSKNDEQQHDREQDNRREEESTKEKEEEEKEK